ncbi:sugar-binding protein [Tengunoibacter tsumagoiensis]|uniref:Ig-like domain-containing protein n=1 Tax=Tengunoibacter tsumagoiensis TaxID=2014871 RepID=A0A401ZZN4_9CHLR|nr:sugar-binding protein [Tengunoibacter tsumagoiensis]GCE12261.1 hypothetical protein KTT_21200 [Tengunoibacter tsumagoiensis]
MKWTRFGLHQMRKSSSLAGRGAMPHAPSYLRGAITALVLMGAVFSTLAISSSSARADGPTVTINKNIQYQQMDGFGGFGAKLPWFSGGPFYDDSFDQNLVNDLGITILRDEVPPQFEATPGVFDATKVASNSCEGQSVPLSDHFGYLQDLKSKADAAGQPLKLIASVWSPPLWMKYVNCVFGGDANWNRLIVSEIPSASVPNDRKADYAAYLVKYIQTIKQQTGIDVYALSIQNEPAFGEPYSSAVYSPEVLKNVIKVVGQAFQQNGITTKIFMPEDVTDFNRISGFVQWAENDPIARQYVSIIAIHGYGPDGVTGAGSQSFWSNAHTLAATYNTPLWQTETSGYSNDWPGAMNLAGSIYTALKYGQVNAWVWWSLSEGGVTNFSLMNNGVPTSLYYASKMYYRYVRPGAVMIDSSSTDPDVLVNAFNNVQSKTLSAVFINQNTTTAKTVNLNFTGSNIPAQFSVYRSSSTENAISVGTINNTDQLTLPPNSIVTITGISGSQDSLQAPTVLTQPQSTNVVEGNSTSLSVAATGTPPLSYQWLRNGSPISGATGSIYTFSAAGSDNGAQYSVQISNGQGSTTSTSATLSVGAFTGGQSATTNSPPTIDGNSSDAIWSTAPSYNLNNTTGSPSGLSASYQSAWDNTNLYYLVKVNDPTYANGTDNVELYLDGNNSKVPNAYIEGDWQYILTWGSTTVSQYQGGANGNTTAGHDISGIQSAQVANGSSGYQVEVKIPWSTLGVTPATGANIGFDIDVAQQSTPGTTAGKVFWNAITDDDWHDPSRFGVLKLGTDSNPTPTPTPTPTPNPTPTPTPTPIPTGSLLASDSFTGTTGAMHAQNTGTGWSNAWNEQNSDTSVPGYTVSSGSALSYANLHTSGNYASGGLGYQTVGRGLDVSASGPFSSYLSNGQIGQSGTTLWVSTLLRKDANTDQENSLTFHNSGINWCTGCSSASVGLGYFGSASNTGGSRYWSIKLGNTVYQSSTQVQVGQTVLLVMRIDFGSTNTVSLFVNPGSLGGNAPSSASAQATSSSTLSFQSLAYYGGNDSNQSSFDEIRIGTTYASVTPTN